MIFTVKSWVLFFPCMIASLRHYLFMFTTYLYTNSHLYLISQLITTKTTPALSTKIPSRDLNQGPKTLTILEFENEVLDHSATMAWFENTFEIIGGKHLEENLM